MINPIQQSLQNKFNFIIKFSDHLSMIIYIVGRFEEALKYFDVVIQKDPKVSENYNNEAMTLDKIYRFEEAVKYYDAAIQKDPEVSDCCKFFFQYYFIITNQQFIHYFRTIQQQQSITKKYMKLIFYIKIYKNIFNLKIIKNLQIILDLDNYLIGKLRIYNYFISLKYMSSSMLVHNKQKSHFLMLSLQNLIIYFLNIQLSQKLIIMLKPIDFRIYSILLILLVCKFPIPFKLDRIYCFINAINFKLFFSGFLASIFKSKLYN
ncbi:unnamed protein product [Paramecium octaurelia]|uniref:Tetratricopeptide repeat protein n=1 Tax=Paramecium octaurelia TaxID=43137 RepID=A0A8S1XVI5_PAROT|nr:unnamed protein product [Paramecium octaurelia]